MHFCGVFVKKADGSQAQMLGPAQSYKAAKKIFSHNNNVSEFLKTQSLIAALPNSHYTAMSLLLRPASQIPYEV